MAHGYLYSKANSQKTGRLTFKADIIENLDDDDVYINEIENLGIFRITKKEFYKSFANVIKSKSYSVDGNYNYSTFPKWARIYLMDLLVTDFKEKHNEVSMKADLLGQEFRQKVRELGEIWRKSEFNKIPSDEMKEAWAALIEEWIADESMPLIVRKSANDMKGCAVQHPSGREIIFSDNTFAIWVCACALNNKIYTLDEIRQMLAKDEIPMVFMLTKGIGQKAKYKKPLGSCILSGWKLCHIDGIGFNSRKRIEEIAIDEIKAHFRKYANPKNMFVVPKEISGLGEVREFIDEQK